MVGGWEWVVECEYMGLVGGGVEVFEVGEECRVWCWLDGYGVVDGCKVDDGWESCREDGNVVLWVGLSVCVGWFF